MPIDHTSRGDFVPLPENVRIKNLRQTVLALADVATAQATRIHFENHNPIPGTRWATHILQNPDEIIGDEYTAEELEDDLNAIGAHLERLLEKYPKYTGKIDWEKFEIGKEVFVSNDLAEIKVVLISLLP